MCRPASARDAEPMPVIEVTDLRKSYGGRPVVDGVSFTVEEGEIFGILGPNGAGKTTTVECVEGLRLPDAGRVRVTGLDPVADHARVSRVLGVQLQQRELQAKLTVREAVEMYASFYPRPLDWAPLAERLGLTAKLTTRFARLSGGQKQRLFIALALIGDPRVVVLDELTRVLGEAADGVEAVEKAAALDPDVILMDLRMPGGGGVDAIRELTRRSARAKVLVLTTYDTDSDTLPAIEAGTTGYLLKDAPRDELFTAVRAAAEGRTVLSPAVASRLVSAVRAPATSPCPRVNARCWPWSPGAPPTVRSPANCSSARRP
jgi:ABC-type branched-subunit amino acid transport system ATPase component